MGSSGKRPENPTEQSQRFIDAARELGCDESEERFNETLRAVAKHKPKPLERDPEHREQPDGERVKPHRKEA